eukprot:scaffold294909_cov15-Tisochrysis_lutea.AAC.1
MHVEALMIVHKKVGAGSYSHSNPGKGWYRRRAAAAQGDVAQNAEQRWHRSQRLSSQAFAPLLLLQLEPGGNLSPANEPGGCLPSNERVGYLSPASEPGVCPSP